MAKARIVFTYDPRTGERTYHIEYESPAHVTGREHERAHARLVRALLGKLLDGGEVEVRRGAAQADAQPSDQATPPQGRRQSQTQ